MLLFLVQATSHNLLFVIYGQRLKLKVLVAYVTQPVEDGGDERGYEELEAIPSRSDVEHFAE